MISKMRSGNPGEYNSSSPVAAQVARKIYGIAQTINTANYVYFGGPRNSSVAHCDVLPKKTMRRWSTTVCSTSSWIAFPTLILLFPESRNRWTPAHRIIASHYPNKKYTFTPAPPIARKQRLLLERLEKRLERGKKGSYLCKYDEKYQMDDGL
jgi:hypothetical protein